MTLLLKGHKSFTQWCLCKVWLQFSLAIGSGQGHSKFCQYSCAISLLSALEKRCDIPFRGSGKPLPYVPSIVKIGSVVKEELILSIFIRRKRLLKSSSWPSTSYLGHLPLFVIPQRMLLKQREDNSSFLPARSSLCLWGF